MTFIYILREVYPLSGIYPLNCAPRGTWCRSARVSSPALLAGRRARVQPGVVLDRLNRLLRKDKLFFPVDPSTASRATIGGMTANNSCGSRSLRYGNMVHNVRAIDAVLASGESMHFGPVPADLEGRLGRAGPRGPVRPRSRPRRSKK